MYNAPRSLYLIIQSFGSKGFFLVAPLVPWVQKTKLVLLGPMPILSNQISWQKVLLFGLGRLILDQAARGAAADMEVVTGLIRTILLRVFPYRKRVVEKNGQLALGLEGAALTKFRHDFYGHFSAVVAEILAGFAMTGNQIAARVTADMRELVEDMDGQSVGIIMPSHLGNWEWMITAGPLLQPFKVLGVYQTLSQSFFEQAFFQNRTKAKGTLTPQRQLLRSLASLPKESQTVVVMAADQAPPVESAFIYPFLGTETGFYTGPQVLANRLQCPIFYARVLPGLFPHTYTLTVLRLKGPAFMKDYARHLERDILKSPNTYLWSHNRFKHTYTSSQDDGSGERKNELNSTV
jgi:KDO2-lipid IV(A) lauroyltransferase